MENGQKDLLDFGRPPLPPWLRLGIAVVVLAALAVLTARLWPGSGPSRPGTGPSASSTPTSAGSPGRPSTTATTRPWPTAPAACDSTADLPIVSSTPPAEHTGIRVLLGGDRLRAVDFDNGATVDLPDPIGPDAEVDLAGGGSPYAIWDPCAPSRRRSTVLRVGADHQVTVVGPLGQRQGVLTDRDRAWVVSSTVGRGHRYDSVRPLAGGDWVRLPSGFSPYAVVGDTLIGPRQPHPTAAPIGVLLVDATTGHTLTNLGRNAQFLAAGRGEVIWSTGCYASMARSCTLHRRLLHTGHRTSYQLPRPPNGFTGTLSDDGKLLAFGLTLARTDSRYQGHPIPPADVAVLHLDTGWLEIVPGIELPAKNSAGLAFTNDGRWLAIALNAGNRIRLLAWRPGLQRPYETTPIAGQVAGYPTLTTLLPVDRLASHPGQ